MSLLQQILISTKKIQRAQPSIESSDNFQRKSIQDNKFRKNKDESQCKILLIM